MSKTNTDYLLDLIQELDDVIAFTIEGEKSFMLDLKTQKAVIRSYEVVGEICKRLPEEFRIAYPQIDWRKLITFCDFLAHNYDLIGLRYVWDAVKDVHRLRAAVQAILDSLPAEDDNSDT
jgi:uncharacterized protein with HEPN domain